MRKYVLTSHLFLKDQLLGNGRSILQQYEVFSHKDLFETLSEHKRKGSTGRVEGSRADNI